MQYYPTIHKKQTDTLYPNTLYLYKVYCCINSTHENWSQVASSIFLVKLLKHTGNHIDICEGLIKILGTQIFSSYGRQTEG